MAALFGKNTGTPAVGMIDIKGSSDNLDHQIGIAILPGGYENPPHRWRLLPARHQGARLDATTISPTRPHQRPERGPRTRRSTAR